MLNAPQSGSEREFRPRLYARSRRTHSGAKPLCARFRRATLSTLGDRAVRRSLGSDACEYRDVAADPNQGHVSELAAERMRELADSAITSGRPLS